MGQLCGKQTYFRKCQYSRCTSQNTEHSHKETVRGAVHLNIGANRFGDCSYFAFQFCDTLRAISIVTILKKVQK